MKESLPEDFYRPTTELATNLLKASQKIRQTENIRLPKPVLEETREDIAQRIWGCMAGMARANTIALGRNRCALDINKALPDLSRTLRRRLSISESDEYLIEDELLPLFLRWLRRAGEYKTPWGVMEYDGETLAFSKIHVRQILNEGFHKAKSKRNGKGHKENIAYAER